MSDYRAGVRAALAGGRETTLAALRELVAGIPLEERAGFGYVLLTAGADLQEGVEVDPGQPMNDDERAIWRAIPSDMLRRVYMMSSAERRHRVGGASETGPCEHYSVQRRLDGMLVCFRCGC